VPCVTMRQNTERPATIEIGTNVLTGLDVRQVVSLTGECYAGKWKTSSIPDLWDGKAAERIAEILLNPSGPCRRREATKIVRSLISERERRKEIDIVGILNCVTRGENS